MRLSPFLAALVVFCCAPVHAEPHTPAPGGCMSLAATRKVAEGIASNAGGGALTLDGDEAHRFLTSMNAFGEPSDWSSDHVGILVFPTQEMALVVRDVPPCGYGAEAYRMPLGFVVKAYRAARGAPT